MRKLVAIVLGFGVASCVTTPKLDPQQPTIASDGLGLSTQVFVPLAAHSWWTPFNDPQLDRLMEQTGCSPGGVLS